jgi:hypothetical protein
MATTGNSCVWFGQFLKKSSPLKLYHKSIMQIHLVSLLDFFVLKKIKERK